jgi:dTDP-4-dehydrorhamnose reductase
MPSDLLDRVLLVGGSGQIGTELRAVLPAGSVTAPSREQLDVENLDSVLAALRLVRPTLVVNTSAYHNTELCERYPERAFAVNALAVDRLAAACAVAGAAFATFSTDYVFDGRGSRPYREEDATGPISAYGASKLAGEHLTRRHGPRHFIIRTSAVYGRSGSTVKGYTFIDRVLTQAAEGRPLKVVDDITFSPSYARDVAVTFRNIAEHGAFGTYHLTNAGSCTWFEFAAEAFRIAGLSPAVEAVPSSIFPSAVARPAYSVLAPAALEREGIEPAPEWRDALARYVAERGAQLEGRLKA